MNDALFIINKPPMPTPDDTGPYEMPNGPKPISAAIDDRNGELIVKAHNDSLSTYRALLEKAAASLAPFAHDAQFMEKGHPDRPAWALYSGSAAFANRDRYKVVRQSFDDARATLASIREALGKGREG